MTMENQQGVLAVGQRSLVKRWTFMDTKSKVARDLRTQDPTYTFVEPGYFDLVLWPMLPILTGLHVMHAYGLYLLLTGQANWACLNVSK